MYVPLKCYQVNPKAVCKKKKKFINKNLPRAPHYVRWSVNIWLNSTGYTWFVFSVCWLNKKEKTKLTDPPHLCGWRNPHAGTLYSDRGLDIVRIHW